MIDHAGVVLIMPVHPLLFLRVLCLLFQGAQNVIRQAIPAQKVALSIRTTLDQVLFVLTVERLHGLGLPILVEVKRATLAFSIQCSLDAMGH